MIELFDYQKQLLKELAAKPQFIVKPARNQTWTMHLFFSAYRIQLKETIR